MLKKTITFKDYNGVERTEDFYFNLTKAELTEMQYSAKGGLEEVISRIVKTQDTPQIIALFKDIIGRAYGQKSIDGRKFIKSQEILDDFTQTEAYSILFMELATDAEKAVDFVNGIMPADIAEEASKKQKAVPVQASIE